MAGFFHHLENVLKGSSTRVLLDSGNAQFRGVEIIAAVDRAASTLDACGVRTGDRVVVQVEKSCHAIFLFLGTLKLGAVFVPLNTSYRLQEFTYFVENSRPTLIVCDPEREAAYSALAAKNGVRLVTLGADGDGSLYESDASNFNPKPFPQISDEHLAAIIYTSGTTGRPKGAMLSHGNVLHNTRALGKVWNITSNDVLLHVLPLYHVHGLFIALSTTLLMGARTRLLPRFEVEATIEELSRATIFMGVPTYYTRLLADVDFTRHAAENVRLFVCGSAPLRVETFDAFLQRSGKRLVERYGMSECGIICANAPDDARRGYVGRPIPDTSVRVTDDQGEVLPSNCIGTLEVRGPSIFGGYWKMPELTASEFRPDGYFVTGDLARIDDAGLVELVGRAKDLIISGGLNVYPIEVETVIDRIPGIRESAVIGLPHGDLGEAVAAVLALEPNFGKFDTRTVFAILKSELAGFKLPKALFVQDVLPRNAMGKIEKAALRTRYAASFAEEVK